MYTKEQLPGMELIHKNYINSKKPCVYTIQKLLAKNVELTWPGCGSPHTDYTIEHVLGLVNSGIWVPWNKSLIYEIY